MRPPTAADESLGLAVIARDEETTLPTLLESIVGAFDQVVLVDTGSIDGTAAVFERWTAEQPDFRWTLERCDWCDDFAKARNYAHSLLETDWHAWADADDEIVGAANLRELAATAPLEVSAFVLPNDATGCFPFRRRLLRAGTFEWVGRMDEYPCMRTGIDVVPRHDVKWLHHKPFAEMLRSRATRDLAILRAWLSQDPSNPVLRLSVDEYGRVAQWLAAADKLSAEARDYLLGMAEEGSRARWHEFIDSLGSEADVLAAMAALPRA